MASFPFFPNQQSAKPVSFPQTPGFTPYPSIATQAPFIPGGGLQSKSDFPVTDLVLLGGKKFSTNSEDNQAKAFKEAFKKLLTVKIHDELPNNVLDSSRGVIIISIVDRFNHEDSSFSKTYADLKKCTKGKEPLLLVLHNTQDCPLNSTQTGKFFNVNPENVIFYRYSSTFNQSGITQYKFDNLNAFKEQIKQKLSYQVLPVGNQTQPIVEQVIPVAKRVFPVMDQAPAHLAPFPSSQGFAAPVKTITQTPSFPAVFPPSKSDFPFSDLYLIGGMQYSSNSDDGHAKAFKEAFKKILSVKVHETLPEKTMDSARGVIVASFGDWFVYDDSAFSTTYEELKKHMKGKEPLLLVLYSSTKECPVNASDVGTFFNINSENVIFFGYKATFRQDGNSVSTQHQFANLEGLKEQLKKKLS